MEVPGPMYETSISVYQPVLLYLQQEVQALSFHLKELKSNEEAAEVQTFFIQCYS